MAVADGAGLPLSVSVASASPNEITLVDAALDALVTDHTPVHLIGDKAYDSNALDAREEARTAVFEYFEVWYNRQRRHSSLGYLCPVACELQQEFSQAA